MSYPECPRHGVGGSEASLVATASVIRYGYSSPKRPRQKFLCTFELVDGTRDRHTFRGGLIPRLMADDPTCRDCGQPLDAWRGEKVFDEYWFPFKPVANALAQLASGTSYRQVASSLRRATGRAADALEPRRLATLALVHALRETGDLADAVLAAEVEAEHPLRGHSREAPLAEWLLQTFAPILHQELAPQSWPEGGIIAVDSVKMNLLGKHKYVDAEGNDLDDYRERDEEGNLLMPPEGAFEIDIPDVETTRPDVFEMLDEDDQEDRDVLSLAAYVPDPPDTRPGLQGGVPCWEILGAYGYERAETGVFPRGEEAGRIWLLRSYFKPNSLAWAHFFRQLEGTPAYVICDMAPAIRVGVELAWPDEKTRPQILVCEHHVIEAIKRRIADDPRLKTEAGRLFLTHGHRVDGDYEEYAPNGIPGSLLRLWHFWEFRRLAREAEHLEFDQLFVTPTWRRIMDQVVQKDNTLRYSTGALESALFQLAETKISWRRGWFKNRRRVDYLLSLMQLEMLGVANQDTFAKIIERYLRHHPMPRQDRLTDPSNLGGSLRRGLSDDELQAHGLLTDHEFESWKERRHMRLHDEVKMDRYHRDPKFRRIILARHKRWLREHAAEESEKALRRKAVSKETDPAKYFAQRGAQRQRHRDRAKKVASVVAKFDCDNDEARFWLEAVGWDLEAVSPSPKAASLQVLLVPPDSKGDSHDS